MQLRGIHHIAIFTRDLARLEAFYTQTLGFPVVRRWDDVGIVFVDAGGLWLELTRQDQSGGSEPHLLDQGVGFNHLALHVVNVDIVFQQLQELGVRVLVPPDDYKNVRVAFFADPDGNVLELIEDRDWRLEIGDWDAASNLQSLISNTSSTTPDV